jgi:lysophospholipase L1-like esterase
VLVPLAACDEPPSIAPRSGCTVGVVGDSLTVGTMPWISEAFEVRGCRLAWVEAAIGRQTSEGVSIIERRAAARQLPSVLVVALGTNDRVDPWAFGPKVERVMKVVGDRPVVWVNIDKPIVESTLNLALALANMRYPNLVVQDWNAFADDHPQIRQADRIHLVDGGYALRAGMIARFITNR